MRRISILNFKGGTGKTSVTENLSHALARLGKTVLVIDGDRQSNTTTTMLGQRASPSLTDVLEGRAKLTEAIYEARPNLFVVPSDTDLDRANKYIRDNPRSYYRLRDSLTRLTTEGIDLVLIDQAGAFSTVMEVLLVACDEMLIPCELEPYAVQGLFDMFSKLKSELDDHELRNSGIIPYNTDMTKKMTGAYIAELRETFGDHLITAAIRTDTAVPYAQSQKLTVFEYAEKFKVKSRAAEDFTHLAERLLAQERV